jgi:hypothetical protein
MPTNPLWLEHTEKAAWDTVKTLRAELVTERARLTRLTELQAIWPRLLARLDQAAAEHELSKTDPLARLDELCARLVSAGAQSDAVAPVESAKDATPTPEPPREDRRRWSPSVRWFAHLIERSRDGRSERVDPARHSRIVQALELRVEELATARRSELLELCIQIGNLALDLARIARRARSE